MACLYPTCLPCHGHHDRERLSDRLGPLRLRRFGLPVGVDALDPLDVALAA
ncbi:hypothetical protein D3C86_1061310 [compost metagenome]